MPFFRAPKLRYSAGEQLKEKAGRGLSKPLRLSHTSRNEIGDVGLMKSPGLSGEQKQPAHLGRPHRAEVFTIILNQYIFGDIHGTRPITF